MFLQQLQRTFLKYLTFHVPHRLLNRTISCMVISRLNAEGSGALVCFSSDAQVIHLYFGVRMGEGSTAGNGCNLFPATQEVCDRGAIQVSGCQVLCFNQKRSLLCLSDRWRQLSRLPKPKRGKTLPVDPLVS